jgi:hypothetical protein
LRSDEHPPVVKARQETKVRNIRARSDCEDLVELAGCGIFDLASQDLDTVIDPIHVHFKKLNAKPGLLLSPVYDAPDQKYPSPRIRTVSTLPGWVKDAFENKVVELIAIVEFLVDNYKMFSTHEERYKEGFTEVLWKEVKTLFKHNALVSPLTDKGSVVKVVSKDSLVHCLSYFHRRGSNINASASKHRDVFKGKVDEFKTWFKGQLPLSLQPAYNSGTLIEWHMMKSPYHHVDNLRLDDEEEVDVNVNSENVDGNEAPSKKKPVHYIPMPMPRPSSMFSRHPQNFGRSLSDANASIIYAMHVDGGVPKSNLTAVLALCYALWFQCAPEINELPSERILDDSFCRLAERDKEA